MQGEGLKIALRASQRFSPEAYLFPCNAIRSRSYGISFDNLRRSAGFLCYNIASGVEMSQGVGAARRREAARTRPLDAAEPLIP